MGATRRRMETTANQQSAASVFCFSVMAAVKTVHGALLAVAFIDGFHQTAAGIRLIETNVHQLLVVHRGRGREVERVFGQQQVLGVTEGRKLQGPFPKGEVPGVLTPLVSWSDNSTNDTVVAKGKGKHRRHVAIRHENDLTCQAFELSIRYGMRNVVRVCSIEVACMFFSNRRCAHTRVISHTCVLKLAASLLDKCTKAQMLRR